MRSNYRSSSLPVINGEKYYKWLIEAFRWSHLVVLCVRFLWETLLVYTPNKDTYGMTFRCRRGYIYKRRWQYWQLTSQTWIELTILGSMLLIICWTLVLASFVQAIPVRKVRWWKFFFYIGISKEASVLFPLLLI